MTNHERTTKKPNRIRSVHHHFWVSEEEDAQIRERMAEMGITTLGAYVRKMAVMGYHITVDLSDVRDLVTLLRICGNNMNQIARRANETRNIYQEDIEDLRERYDSLWEVADKILKGLAKIT